MKIEYLNEQEWGFLMDHLKLNPKEVKDEVIVYDEDDHVITFKKGF